MTAEPEGRAHAAGGKRRLGERVDEDERGHVAWATTREGERDRRAHAVADQRERSDAVCVDERRDDVDVAGEGHAVRGSRRGAESGEVEGEDLVAGVDQERRDVTPDRVGRSAVVEE